MIYNFISIHVRPRALIKYPSIIYQHIVSILQTNIICRLNDNKFSVNCNIMDKAICH